MRRLGILGALFASSTAALLFHHQRSNLRLNAETSDKDKEKEKPEASMWDSMKNGLKGALSFTSQITEPSVDKFLPAPALDQFGRSPRTIVIDLEGTLVNCDWTREEGWIVTKRPGTDEFLSRLFQAGFEIVLFSENPEYVAQPIMNNLDTQGRAPHRLFKEHLSWGNGVYWKNLKLMNRDLSRLILIEDNKEAFAFNRDNTILIPSWNKDQTDNQLVKLVPFLVSLSQNDVKDVRETLRFYGNENTADNWIAEKKEKRKNSEQKRSSGGFLGSVRKPSLPSKKD